MSGSLSGLGQPGPGASSVQPAPSPGPPAAADPTSGLGRPAADQSGLSHLGVLPGPGVVPPGETPLSARQPTSPPEAARPESTRPEVSRSEVARPELARPESTPAATGGLPSGLTAAPGHPQPEPSPAETPSAFGAGPGSEQPSGLRRAPEPAGGDRDPAAGRSRLEPPNMGQLNRPLSDGPQQLSPPLATPEPVNPQLASPQSVNPPHATEPGGRPPARAKRPRLEPPNMGQLNRPLNSSGDH